MLNFKEIENRIKSHTGLSEGKDIAALFNMTPQNYSNKKGLGTLLPIIIEWAIQENVNLDWLLKGDKNVSVCVAEPSAPFFPNTSKDRFKLKLTSMLSRILDEEDEKKIRAVESQLDLLDPGEKKQRVVNESDGGAGAKNRRVA